LNEAILRQLILKVDRQLEDDLLAQAHSSGGGEGTEAAGDSSNRSDSD
jgi:hypothetical protein